MKELQKALRRPEGNLLLEYRSDLFAEEGSVIPILELVAGAHVFRVERTPEMDLAFFYSSPGTGTRVAKVPITSVEGAESVQYLLRWSPELTRLTIAVPEQPESEVSSEGVPSMREYRVATDGSVVQLGSEGIKTLSYSFFKGGEPILVYTALEAWRETLECVRLLLEGVAEGARDFPVVQGNLCLVMLVTGFETYGRHRLLELEGEGIEPDFEVLANKVFSKGERDAGDIDAIRAQANKENSTPLRVLLVDWGRINFQDYDQARTAFSKAYGIKFGQLEGVTSAQLTVVQHTIRYRHRIVHASPRIVWLNQPWDAKGQAVMAGPETAREAAAAFEALIEAIHAASLRAHGG